MEKELSFKSKVERYMRTIPRGKVVSYSDVSVACGKIGAARIVGQIAHFGNTDIPWHRLVHNNGTLANGFIPGGPLHQAILLRTEGVRIVHNKVDMLMHRYRQ